MEAFEEIPKTVTELRIMISKHGNLGISQVLRDSINHCIDKKKITIGSDLNPESVEEIKQAFYELYDSWKNDSAYMLTILQLSMISNSPSDNPLDDAIEYLAELQEKLR